MSLIDIKLAGQGRCRIRHQESGVEIESSKAAEYGGRGDSFSSTDLLAAALGSCIGTNLEPIAERNGIPLDQICIRIEKTLQSSPKRLASLSVSICIGPGVSPSLITRLERAASHCLVHKSLSPEIDVSICLSDGALPA